MGKLHKKRIHPIPVNLPRDDPVFINDDDELTWVSFSINYKPI